MKFTSAYYGLIAALSSLVVVAYALTEEEICKGAKDAVLVTTLEQDNNPCGICTYDATTQRLTLECRYSYCESCADDICGVRVVEVSTVLTEAELVTFADGGALAIGSDTKYCIDYTGGPFPNSMICVMVDDSFNTDACGAADLEYGLPLLSCSGANDCECMGDGEPDMTSKYVGFGAIAFNSCYSGSVKADKAVSGASVVGAGALSAALLVALAM